MLTVDGRRQGIVVRQVLRLVRSLGISRIPDFIADLEVGNGPVRMGAVVEDISEPLQIAAGGSVAVLADENGRRPNRGKEFHKEIGAHVVGGAGLGPIVAVGGAATRPLNRADADFLESIEHIFAQPIGIGGGGLSTNVEPALDVSAEPLHQDAENLLPDGYLGGVDIDRERVRGRAARGAGTRDWGTARARCAASDGCPTGASTSAARTTTVAIRAARCRRAAQTAAVAARAAPGDRTTATAARGRR